MSESEGTKAAGGPTRLWPVLVFCGIVGAVLWLRSPTLPPGVAQDCAAAGPEAASAEVRTAATFLRTERDARRSVSDT